MHFVNCDQDNDMATGPGKYDDIATFARTTTGARAAIVLILEGLRGSGFSVQTDASIDPLRLADMLEYIARDLRNRAGISA